MSLLASYIFIMKTLHFKCKYVYEESIPSITSLYRIRNRQDELRHHLTFWFFCFSPSLCHRQQFHFNCRSISIALTTTHSIRLQHTIYLHNRIHNKNTLEVWGRRWTTTTKNNNAKTKIISTTNAAGDRPARLRCIHIYHARYLTNLYSNDQESLHQDRTHSRHCPQFIIWITGETSSILCFSLKVSRVFAFLSLWIEKHDLMTITYYKYVKYHFIISYIREAHYDGNPALDE